MKSSNTRYSSSYWKEWLDQHRSLEETSLTDIDANGILDKSIDNAHNIEKVKHYTKRVYKNTPVRPRALAMKENQYHFNNKVKENLSFLNEMLSTEDLYKQSCQRTSNEIVQYEPIKSRHTVNNPLPTPIPAGGKMTSYSPSRPPILPTITSRCEIHTVAELDGDRRNVPSAVFPTDCRFNNYAVNPPQMGSTSSSGLLTAKGVPGFAFPSSERFTSIEDDKHRPDILPGPSDYKVDVGGDQSCSDVLLFDRG